jgi:hypothetical protein
MGSLRSISLRLAGPLLLAAACTACIIEPNQIPDAGVLADAGTTPADGGPDAGIVGGAVSATVGTMSGSQTVAWIGLALAGSSTDVPGQATQVLLNGASDTGGNISLYMTNLIPGTTNVALASIGYQAPSSAPDGWTCSPNPNAVTMCSGTATVTSYDGHTLVGTFSGQFGAASSVQHVSTLSLTNGTFSLTLP